jgi:hypothetical protein
MSGRRSTTRTVTIGGQTMIVLDLDEFERLDQDRRRLGGTVNQMSILRHRVRERDAVLDAIAEALAPHVTVHPELAEACVLCDIRRRVNAR